MQCKCFLDYDYAVCQNTQLLYLPMVIKVAQAE